MWNRLVNSWLVESLKEKHIQCYIEGYGRLSFCRLYTCPLTLFFFAFLNAISQRRVDIFFRQHAIKMLFDSIENIRRIPFVLMLSTRASPVERTLFPRGFPESRSQWKMSPSCLRRSRSHTRHRSSPPSSLDKLPSRQSIRSDTSGSSPVGAPVVIKEASAAMAADISTGGLGERRGARGPTGLHRFVSVHRHVLTLTTTYVADKESRRTTTQRPRHRTQATARLLLSMASSEWAI